MEANFRIGSLERIDFSRPSSFHIGADAALRAREAVRPYVRAWVRSYSEDDFEAGLLQIAEMLRTAAAVLPGGRTQVVLRDLLAETILTG